MSDSKAAETALAADANSEVEVVETKTPTKRTPKRKADSFQKESEELLKNLGVPVDMDDGRRRTRSSARGATATPPSTPATPPAKRARGSLTTPRRGGSHGKLEEEDPEEGTQEGKSTPKKRGVPGPKKLADLVEDDQKQDEESGAKSTDAEKKGNNEVKKAVKSEADEKSVDLQAEAKASRPIDSEKDEPEKDEADSGKAIPDETNLPGKSDDCKPVEKLEEKKQSVDVAAKEEKKVVASVVESKQARKPAEEPMEVDEQDTKPSVVTKTTTQDEAAKVTAEPKQPTDAVQQTPKDAADLTAEVKEAAIAESNGSNDSGAVVTQQKASEKVVVSAVKDVDAKIPVAVEENSSTDGGESVESTTPESDKAVKKVDSTMPTENNVAEKVSANVESKIVTNDSAAVEPATAP